MKSWLRVYWFNMLATPGDWKRLGFGLKPSGIPWSVNASAQTVTFSPYDWDWCTQVYPQPDVPRHSTAVLGIPDAWELLKNDELRRAAYKSLLLNSVGHPGWSLASIGFWLLSLDNAVVQWLSDGGWFTHSPKQWVSCAKDKLTRLRRVLHLSGSLDLPVSCCLLFRKLANICGRDTEEADWEAELARRTVDTPAHVYPHSNGLLSRSSWVQKSVDYLTKFVHEVVGTMLEDMRLEPLDMWWESRYAWAPKGSSSQASIVSKEYSNQGVLLDKNARANKKAVISTLSDDWMLNTLASYPTKKPRRSTKNEPGYKNRALYAQDDESFMVSSYASVAMEKNINIDGIYAQQSPQDVATWVRNHMLAVDLGLFFMSLDYSDYNTEHEISMLAMLDLLWARAWSKLGRATSIGPEKAYCAWWSACAHLNSWVNFDGEWCRIFGGLFSGDRNTARDNCILHSLYSHLMQSAAREWLPSFRLYNLAMTGDDEDANFSSWIHAALYMWLHDRAGFVLKPEKQITGDKTIPVHEYLQRSLDHDPRPSRPLCAALAQLCSGNWYKDTYIWFDGVLDSVNSNLWELHLRGLPLQPTQQLAIHVLNRVMQVRKDIGWVKLEWWDYRTNGRYSPLWGCTTVQAPRVSDGSSAVVPLQCSAGVTAWVDKNRRRFGDLLTERDLQRYAYESSQEAYGSLFPKARNRHMHGEVASLWPERTNMSPAPCTCYGGRLTLSAFMKLLKHTGGERRPITDAELASKFGVDTKLLTAIGGWRKLLTHAAPKDMAYWEKPISPAVMPKWALWEDPAIQSWLRDTYSVLPANGLVEPPPFVGVTAASYSIIVASNASGKTTAIRQLPVGLAIDLDDLMRDSGALAFLKLVGRQQLHKLPLAVVTRCKNMLDRQQARVILAQYPPAYILQILHSVRKHVDQVLIVEADAFTMWQRTAEERGWDTTKCLRRTARFDDVVKQWEEAYSGPISRHTTIQSALSHMALVHGTAPPP